MKAFLAWYSLNWRPDSIILMIFSYNKMLTNCLRKIQTFNTADLSFFSVLLFASFSGSCKFFKDVCRHVFRFNRSTIFCCRPFPGAPSALSCDLSQVVSHTAQLSALLENKLFFCIDTFVFVSQLKGKAQMIVPCVQVKKKRSSGCFT